MRFLEGRIAWGCGRDDHRHRAEKSCDIPRTCTASRARRSRYEKAERAKARPRSKRGQLKRWRLAGVAGAQQGGAAEGEGGNIVRSSVSCPKSRRGSPALRRKTQMLKRNADVSWRAIASPAGAYIVRTLPPMASALGDDEKAKGYDGVPSPSVSTYRGPEHAPAEARSSEYAESPAAAAHLSRRHGSDALAARIEDRHATITAAKRKGRLGSSGTREWRDRDGRAQTPAQQTSRTRIVVVVQGQGMLRDAAPVHSLPVAGDARGLREGTYILHDMLASRASAQSA